MRKNDAEIQNIVKRFGSKIVLEKLKELYIVDPLFDEFCNKFEEVFKTDFKSINKRVIYIFEKHSEKKTLDKNCFIHLCIEYEFRYNLKQIGYQRFMIFTAKKSVTGLNERIPVHKEYLNKINQFKTLWK